jgi:predicted dehydrogenase
VKRVVAMSSIPSPTRTITSKLRYGEKINVETPTTIFGLLEFENGAIVSLGTSWDVWSHGHSNMELYGELGTLHVPDPNFFGGDVRMTKGNKPVAKLPAFAHPFALPNEQHAQGTRANYRAAGLADMAQAIIEGRPHRCSQEMALHAIEVMTALLKSGEAGKPIAMTTSCERPAPLGIAEAKALLSKKARAGDSATARKRKKAN